MHHQFVVVNELVPEVLGACYCLKKSAIRLETSPTLPKMHTIQICIPLFFTSCGWLCPSVGFKIAEICSDFQQASLKYMLLQCLPKFSLYSTLSLLSGIYLSSIYHVCLLLLSHSPINRLLCVFVRKARLHQPLVMECSMALPSKVCEFMLLISLWQQYLHSNCTLFNAAFASLLLNHPEYSLGKALMSAQYISDSCRLTLFQVGVKYAYICIQ